MISLNLNLLNGSIGGSDPAMAIAALKRATTPGVQEKGVAQERKDPVTIAALRQFDKALAGAKDLKQALSDPRVLAVVLPAVGLADQVNNPGLVYKALTADLSKPGNLAAVLGNRWKAAAEKLDLNGKDITALKDPALIQSLKDSYVTYQYQKGLDEKTPGMSDALYFIKQAGENNDNVYNVLGDAILRRVVTGALGLPRELAIQPVETQATAVTRRLPMSQLDDPKAVYKLAQRYLMASAGSGASGGSDLTSLALSLRA